MSNYFGENKFTLYNGFCTRLKNTTAYNEYYYNDRAKRNTAKTFL